MFTYIIVTNAIYNCAGFVGECVGFADKECMVWYMLFIIFVPYAMLPLPLIYCMVAGTVSGIAHIIVMTIEKLQTTYVRYQLLRILSNIITDRRSYVKYTFNLRTFKGLCKINTFL